MAVQMLRTDDYALYAVTLPCPHCGNAEVTATVRVTIARTPDHMNAYDVPSIALPHFLTSAQREAIEMDACVDASTEFEAKKEIAIRSSRFGFDVFTVPAQAAFARN